MNDQDRGQRVRELQADWERALREHGTQSIEYRRAARRMYRFLQRRIDFLPDRGVMEIIERAIETGNAWSYSDAINRAVKAWGSSFQLPKPNPPG